MIKFINIVDTFGSFRTRPSLCSYNNYILRREAGVLCVLRKGKKKKQGNASNVSGKKGRRNIQYGHAFKYKHVSISSALSMTQYAVLLSSDGSRARNYVHFINLIQRLGQWVNLQRMPAPASFLRCRHDYRTSL